MGRPGLVPFHARLPGDVHPFALGARVTNSIRWVLAAMALWVSLYQLHWLGKKSLGSPPAPCDPAQTCVIVDGSELKPMSPVMWGIAFEEINHAGEGGLYVEMLRDRSFEGRAYLLTHPDVVPAKTVPNQGAPLPSRSTSRLQAASMDPTSVASAKMMDLHAWIFSNNIVASMHDVSDPPGLHACCMRIEGADKDPESVGQVVNTGHSLEGIAVHAGKPYRLRMRVQGVVDDLQVVLTSGDGSETLASLRFPTITQQPLAARSRAVITDTGLASHGAQVEPHKTHDSQQEDNKVLGPLRQQEQQLEQTRKPVEQQVQQQVQQTEEGKHKEQEAEEERRRVLDEMQQLRREEEAKHKVEAERRQQSLESHPHLQQQLVQGDDVGSDSLGGIWHELVGLMTPSQSATDARLAVRFTGAGYLCIEWVSLMPEDAWNPRASDAQDDATDAVDEGAEVKAAGPATLRFSDRPYPFNRALMKALSEMQPQFIRFPGGAFVEGVDLGTALRWKSTVGPAERRPGHPNANWGYWSTDGLGLFEFMELAEELDTEPVWVVNVGISQSESTNPDQLITDGWLQDTLDALEFILEEATPENKWASLRASMGRESPWPLTYVTLGNEECLRPWYAQHYERVASAIRARYPNLKLIANCDLGPGFDYAAWEFHTYRDAGSTFRLRSLFDEYQGRPVAVTEFAAMTSAETVQGAMAEAGLMTAMERNCDKFMLGAFAPLLGHAQLRTWRPNLIVYGADGSWYGTPSYEVQKLFMKAAGAYCGQVTMDGLRNHNMDASVVCKDELCSSSATKIVNFSPNATQVRLRLKPRPLSKVLDRFSPGMMQHPRVAKLALWELSSLNPSTDNNDFMKPSAPTPREKYSVIRNIGRGWREAHIHLPPISMVLVEVKDIDMR